MTAFGTSAVRRVPTTSALGRVTAVLLALVVGVNALYLVGLVAADGETNPLLNVGVSLGTQWIPAAVFWVVAARTRFRNVALLFAAAGVTFTALGDTYYSFAMDADGYLPFPSLADPAYLLFYPLMVAALGALAHGRLRGAGGLAVLETAVATVGASAVLAVVLDPVIGDALAGEDPLAGAVAVAYPLFDLLLLAVIAGIAAVPTGRIGRRWWALVTGLAVFAVGDVVYAVQEHAGTYLAGSPLDATWAIGLGFVTWWGAGVARPEHPHDADRAPRRVPAVVPAVAVVAGLGVLVVASRWELSPLAVGLAAVTVGLGAAPLVFRQAVLGRMLATQDEAMRRLTELDRAKTDLMVTMNHEFRTPLTSITGSVELLLDGVAGELPESADRMLRTIERNGTRLESLIEATLTAAQLEDDRGTLDRVPLKIADLVAEVVARRRLDADARGLDLDLVIADDSIVVEADAAHLGRALDNLLDNALKFTPRGGLVTVAVGPWSRNAMNIHIGDTGIGIPAADIPQLFGRYFRASNVQNAAIPGVGLGLSIAHHIVRAHDGSIHVESVPERGTTVTVTLPLPVARSRFGVRRARASRD